MSENSEKIVSNKIASNTVIQIIGRVFILALSLISIKLITNYLGPEGTGFYTTVVTYFSFFIVIADFGLFSVVVREISKSPERLKKLFANVFTIRFVSVIFFTAIAVLIATLTDYPPEIKRGILLASLFPIFNLAGSVYDMYFQYKMTMHNVVYAEIISKIITVGLIYYFATTGAGYFYIVFTVSVAALIMFVAKALLSKKDVPLHFEFDKKLIKEILVMSAPLGIVFIVNNIYFKVDALLLFHFKGAVDAGIYAVSYRVLESTLFAGSYLTSSLKPLLSRSVDDNKELAQKAITSGITYLLFLALVVAVVCLTFPREIILFLSDSEFLAGTTALVILGFASIFIYIGGLFGEIMIAKDKRKAMIGISTFIVIFNVSLNLYLIPRYSYNGAALATLISEIVLIILSYQVARRIVPIVFDHLRIFKLLGIALLSVIIGYSLKNTGMYFLINTLIISLFFCLFAYKAHALPRGSLDNYLLALKKRWLK